MDASLGVRIKPLDSWFRKATKETDKLHVFFWYPNTKEAIQFHDAPMPRSTAWDVLCGDVISAVRSGWTNVLEARGNMIIKNLFEV